MSKNSFTEEDKKKLINFLNVVAEHATLEVKTQQVIEYFKSLAHIQQVLLPKIDSHILEVKKIIEPEKPKRTRKK